MSELSIHPNGNVEGGEHRSPVAAIVEMGRHAVGAVVEAAKFAANTFTEAGEERNAAKYADKGNSSDARERHYAEVHNSQSSQDRRARRAERSADWEYGVVGRARVAAHRSPMAAIAMNRQPRHPKDVPGYRSRRTGKYN